LFKSNDATHCEGGEDVKVSGRRIGRSWRRQSDQPSKATHVSKEKSGLPHNDQVRFNSIICEHR
jgi:hypothetical protein